MLKLVSASATALICLAAFAAADEPQLFPCGPLDRFKAMVEGRGEALVTLSPEQFQFARGLFVMAPDTPSSLPPGDSAAMAARTDGTASIVYIDGDKACAPMKIGKEGLEILMQVGRGEVVHSGGAL